MQLAFQSHLYGIESGSCRTLRTFLMRFNRTFMELKVMGGHWPRLGRIVSIAPLWNWKLGTQLTRQRLRQFQSHLYGIERRTEGEGHTHLGAFQSHLYGIERRLVEGERRFFGRFNRTFMELKVIQRLEIVAPLWVSIAPLWNWKKANITTRTVFYSFNRTFMELKDGKKTVTSVGRSVSIAPLWNWKRRQRWDVQQGESFNRTFMELKDVLPSALENSVLFQSHLYGIESEGGAQDCNGTRVSIAPLWNWKRTNRRQTLVLPSFNHTFLELKAGRAPDMGTTRVTFQSHLYGIESDIHATNAHATSMFQSHLYGIESSCRSPWTCRRLGFNRTFMELKAIIKWHNRKVLMFQSHLYGIESRRSWGSSSCSPAFQSHLYGIESAIFHGECYAVACFNRTFMELKGWWRYCSRHAAEVSIAPLWNWKYFIFHTMFYKV